MSKFGNLSISLLLFVLVMTSGIAEVKIWEESVVMPTYTVAPADKNPRFYDGRVTQGAQGRVYPYPMSDVLTNERSQKTYQMVYLENDYVKIAVLPQFGGRIFSATDKTNNYEFFYKQSVVKPALIGTLGAWISGGVEWNFPHHHRPTTLLPVDYWIQRHPDGSATLWTADTERRHRMRLYMSITLHPDRSYVEVMVHPYNQSPLAHSFLYFANPAVHVDSTYEVIFPPDVEYVTQHAKREFSEWPISFSHYGGYQYEGVDISKWKNLPRPVSFFAWSPKSDYFAGYNHGLQAGVAYVSNHYVAPGMKFFAWGDNEENLMWDTMLTDTDGSYLELMAGAYSDNQPDYSWLQPYEAKQVKQYWFPIRNLEGLKYANLNGALNIELSEEGLAQFRLNTTTAYKGAKVVLKAAGNSVHEEVIDIDPGRPFQGEITVPAGTAEYDLSFELRASDGEVLVAYSPLRKAGIARPEAVTPPPPPEEIKTVEELYLAGLRLNQFYNAVIDAYPYYEEALRRDPGDYRVNTQMGILYLKRLMWSEAEKSLRLAVKRITHHYTMPKDGEAFYYLGLAMLAQGKLADAYENFYKATWSVEWHSPAYFSLAQIDCRRGDYLRALAHLERSISTNSENLKALNLRALVLRKLNRLESARKQIDEVILKNPLDLQSRNELIYLLDVDKKKEDELQSLKAVMRGEAEAYLELATYYGNPGFWDEAIEVLERIALEGAETRSQHPMVYYYLGYYWAQKGETSKALQYTSRGGEVSPDYCFPYRAESLEVLESARRLNPDDSLAPYYLGNLLFDHQPERAEQAWEDSRRLDGSLGVVHRNLALAYSRNEGDLHKAIASMERAVELAPQDPRLFYELDLLLEDAGVSLERRREVLESHLSVVENRVDSLTRLVLVYVQSGDLDRAIEVLGNHRFNRWEGGGMVRTLYVDAHLLRGNKRLQKGDSGSALSDFKAADAFPPNLEQGRPISDSRFAQVFYYLGVGFEAAGDRGKAEEYWRLAAKTEAQGDGLYYQGLALSRLQEDLLADSKFNQFWDFAYSKSQSDFFAKFSDMGSMEIQLAEVHYLRGLAFRGKGDEVRAREQLKLALEKNPNHYWASLHLQNH